MSDSPEQFKELQALVNKIGTVVNTLLPNQTPFILVVIPPIGHVTFSNIEQSEMIPQLMRQISDAIVDHRRAEDAAKKKEDEEPPGGLH